MNFLQKSQGTPSQNVRRIAGVAVGIVTNNVDDQGGYRVKVRFPWLPNGGDQGEESHWCRVANFMSGNERGAFWLPEVNDEVLVGIPGGDPDRPVIAGSVPTPSPIAGAE